MTAASSLAQEPGRVSCPVQDSPPCSIELQGPGAPALSAACTSGGWAERLRFPLPGRWADVDKDGFHETVVELRLDPVRDCGCAQLRVYFADEVSGWVLHVGNSPTNDGYGGDMGTTLHAAEVHLADRQLSAYTAPHATGNPVERILHAWLPPLSRKVLAIEVCDQQFEIELGQARGDLDPLRLELETHTFEQLFRLGPADDSATGPAAGAIYAAFNRVVHHVNGAASHGRTGRGVRRVEISLIP
jgi:hypothetical protein